MRSDKSDKVKLDFLYHAVVLGDTMWNGTKKLAEKISEGIRLAAPDVGVKLLNLAKSDENDLITEVFKSKASSILHSVAGFIHLMKELKIRFNMSLLLVYPDRNAERVCTQ